MNPLYDYSITIRDVRIGVLPDEWSLRLHCDKTDYVIPTTTKDYKNALSHLSCKQCSCEQNVTFDITYLDCPSHLLAEITQKDIRRYHNLFDKWITVFYENTTKIAGAIQVTLLMSCSQVPDIDDNVTKSTTAKYFPDVYEHRRSIPHTISNEMAPPASKLGYFGPYYM
ncbi:hypothetical protein WA171_000458 [Blastocystis sp. BT1]